MKEVGIIMVIILGMYLFKDYHFTKIGILILGFAVLSG